MSLLLRRHAMLSQIAEEPPSDLPLVEFAFDDGQLSPEQAPVNTGTADVEPIGTTSQYGMAQDVIGSWRYRDYGDGEGNITTFGTLNYADIDALRVSYIDVDGNDVAAKFREIQVGTEICLANGEQRYSVDSIEDEADNSRIIFNVTHVAGTGSFAYSEISFFNAFVSSTYGPHREPGLPATLTISPTGIALPLNCTLVADLRPRDNVITSGSTVIDGRDPTTPRTGFRFQVLGTPDWYFQMIFGTDDGAGGDQQNIVQATPTDRAGNHVCRLAMTVSNGTDILYYVRMDGGSIAQVGSKTISVPYTSPLPTKAEWALSGGAATEHHGLRVYGRTLTMQEIDAI